MKLSEWIQKTNKFLRQDGLKLSQEIIEELRDQQRFVLLDIENNILFTAQLDLEEYPQVFEASTSFQPPSVMMFHGRPVMPDFESSSQEKAVVENRNKKSGYDWNREPNHKLNEAHAIRAGLEEQNATLDRLLKEANEKPQNSPNTSDNRYDQKSINAFTLSPLAKKIWMIVDCRTS